MKCEYSRTCPDFEYESFACYTFRRLCPIRGIYRAEEQTKKEEVRGLELKLEAEHLIKLSGQMK